MGNFDGSGADWAHGAAMNRIMKTLNFEQQLPEPVSPKIIHSFERAISTIASRLVGKPSFAINHHSFWKDSYFLESFSSCIDP